MGQISDDVRKAKLFFAVLASSEEALQTATQRIAVDFSYLETESAVVSFDHTSAFAAEMGTNLVRQWVSTHLPIFLPELVEIKRFTTKLEAIFSNMGRRTVNLDPGYVTGAKVVIATSSDQRHRLYISRGVYEEVVLHTDGAGSQYNPWPWTYPDYKSPEAQEFFSKVRQKYMEFERSTNATEI